MKSLIFAIIYSLLIVTSVFAEDATIELAWDQVISNDFAGWTVYWGVQSGGPYDKGQVNIPYDGSGATVYTSKQTISVPDNVETEYFFILKARDINNRISPPSNEASWKFDFLAPDTPTNFSVTIKLINH